MLPITDYIGEGDTIYLAVHTKYADRLPDLGAAVIAAAKPLKEFRLLLMVFSDQLEVMYLCNQTTIESLRYVVAVHREWRQGNALDPAIGVALYDFGATHSRKRATLFVFSDGDVACYWNPSTLTQLIDVVWLHEPGTLPVGTPFGHRHEALIDPMNENDDDSPQRDGQDKG